MKDVVNFAMTWNPPRNFCTCQFKLLDIYACCKITFMKLQRSSLHFKH